MKWIVREIKVFLSLKCLGEFRYEVEDDLQYEMRKTLSILWLTIVSTIGWLTCQWGYNV